MKNLIIFVMCVVFSALITSCSTTEKLPRQKKVMKTAYSLVESKKAEFLSNTFADSVNGAKIYDVLYFQLKDQVEAAFISTEKNWRNACSDDINSPTKFKVKLKNRRWAKEYRDINKTFISQWELYVAEYQKQRLVLKDKPAIDKFRKDKIDAAVNATMNSFKANIINWLKVKGFVFPPN